MVSMSRKPKVVWGQKYPDARPKSRAPPDESVPPTRAQRLKSSPAQQKQAQASVARQDAIVEATPAAKDRAQLAKKAESPAAAHDERHIEPAKAAPQVSMIVAVKASEEATRKAQAEQKAHALAETQAAEEEAEATRATAEEVETARVAADEAEAARVVKEEAEAARVAAEDLEAEQQHEDPDDVELLATACKQTEAVLAQSSQSSPVEASKPHPSRSSRRRRFSVSMISAGAAEQLSSLPEVIQEIEIDVMGTHFLWPAWAVDIHRPVERIEMAMVPSFTWGHTALE